MYRVVHCGGYFRSPKLYVVHCAGNLDREKMALHTFQVSASTTNGTTITRSTCYSVTVLDENDNAPTFLGPTFHELTLPEDTVVSSGRGWRGVV